MLQPILSPEALLAELLRLLPGLTEPLEASFTHRGQTVTLTVTITPVPSGEPKHSQDFRSVNWFGRPYVFTAVQAAVVRQLWAAWKNGTPEVGQETLLEASGSEANKISDLFRDHSAWNALVVAGSCRGTYRLAEPATEQEDPAPAREPQEMSTCVADILRTLREVGHRLTTTGLLAAMESKGRIHGENTVKTKLAEMVRVGQLTTRRDVDPAGYWIADEPLPQTPLQSITAQRLSHANGNGH